MPSSGWNPWAMRYEPAFFAKYVAALYTNYKVTASEAYARGFSWGLMQVMGQVARETGFEGLFLSALCDPEQSLALGCKVLRKKFDAHGGDCTRALLAWNGGSNAAYPALPEKGTKWRKTTRSRELSGNILFGDMVTTYIEKSFFKRHRT
jgi:hypothetical protein